MALGWTYIVYRLPPELRYADGETVRRAVLEEHPPTEAKVGQWDSHGPTTVEPAPAGAEETGIFVKSNSGYPETHLVRGKAVLHHCPSLDRDEWVVLDAWDMS